MRTYRDSFQYKVVTGRFTLSVAVLMALLLWGTTGEIKEGFLARVACAAVVYLLIEMTTLFSLVHVRSTFPSSLYLLYCSAFPFLHVADIRCVVPVLFLCMMVGLLRSYESPHAPLFVFHTFFCLGLITWIIPYYISFLPVIYLLVLYARSFTARSFFAGWSGLLLPYWLYGGYCAFTNDFAPLVAQWHRFVEIQPVDYSGFGWQHWLGLGLVLSFSILCCGCVYVFTYKDRVQTRIYLHMWMLVQLWGGLLLLLQPQYYVDLLTLQLVLGAVSGAYVFSFRFSRFMNVLFLLSAVGWLSVCVVNVWMHFFSY